MTVGGSGSPDKAPDTPRDSIAQLSKDNGKDLRFEDIKYHVFKGRGIGEFHLLLFYVARE
ncbi:hypothetical protein CSKR_201804 [Clonorchis sinensis]|uniref:Uncharacterized protein n=1 Tax=Clonorchis sinensis TaxID=79923 RepID=A0A8T1MWZ4_CLOSI|nr:hypothetical protein CSKR_201804 [Clonorchis sinensis]